MGLPTLPLKKQFTKLFCAKKLRFKKNRHILL